MCIYINLHRSAFEKLNSVERYKKKENTVSKTYEYGQEIPQ